MVEQSIMQTGMTLDEFIWRYDGTRPIEIHGRKVVPQPPDSVKQGMIAARITLLLVAVTPSEVFRKMLYVRMGQSQQIIHALFPDILLIGNTRLEQYKQATTNWLDLPLMTPPDLTVDILAPDDRFVDVDRKARLYIEDGVKLAWVVNPEGRNIYVCIPDSNTVTIVQGNDTLTGGAASFFSEGKRPVCGFGVMENNCCFWCDLSLRVCNA